MKIKPHRCDPAATGATGKGSFAGARQAQQMGVGLQENNRSQDFITEKGLYLFHSGHKLLGNICADGSVLKLQFGEVLWLQGLQHSDHFAVLACSSRLLLVGELKPKPQQSPRHHITHDTKNSFLWKISPILQPILVWDGKEFKFKIP